MTSSPSSGSAPFNESLLHAIGHYWNQHIHDVQIATSPIGSLSFFQELDEYRFDKLPYLQKVVDSSAYRGKELLEVGCGVGTDLVRFAKAGALVTGIDLSEVAVDLAHRNFARRELLAHLQVMNGEAMQFEDNSFDVVYAHGVLQYTAVGQQMVNEMHRVLRPGGEAILMAYNKYSWLNALSKISKVDLEHKDAPVMSKISIGEFNSLLSPFTSVRIVPERFPVRTRLHRGLKAELYNSIFVKVFHLLPKALVRPVGWHLMAFAHK